MCAPSRLFCIPTHAQGGIIAWATENRVRPIEITGQNCPIGFLLYDNYTRLRRRRWKQNKRSDHCFGNGFGPRARKHLQKVMCGSVSYRTTRVRARERYKAFIVSTAVYSRGGVSLVLNHPPSEMSLYVSLRPSRVPMYFYTEPSSKL